MKLSYKIVLFLALLLSALIYGYLGYFHERADFTSFIISIILLFSFYYLFSFSKLKFKNSIHILFFGFALRIIFITSAPELSDDYYRLLWDGNLIEQGKNPYLKLPSELISSNKIKVSPEMKGYYEKMNSPNYYSVYPPLLQMTFVGSTALSKIISCSPILIYRIFVLVSELVLILVLMQLLKVLKIPIERISVYIFNPLIILEFVGNFHGEIFVITSLMLTILLITKDKIFLAGIVLGCAISFKLTPLIFMPLLLAYLGWKKGMIICTISGIFFLLTFLPFIDLFVIQHISQSVDLYFQNFEFNASILNISQAIGYRINGQSNVHLIGKTLAVSTFVVILLLSFWKREKTISTLIQRLSFIVFAYLLLASVVHPWYITPLIVFAVIVPNRVSISWSFLIFFSYITYSVSPYKENLFIIFSSYFLLLIIFILDYFSVFKREKQIISI